MPLLPVTPPNLKQDWKFIALLALIVFAVGCGMRVQDVARWDNDAMRVGGEYIMGTHDAYHWLAGAKGVGKATGSFLAEFARIVSGATGLSLGTVAFWTPAVAGGLVAVAMLLWAWVLGCVEAGLLAGVLVTLEPGFYFRTRLGYYDTDVVTLLLPLFIAWSLAYWLQPYLDGTSVVGRLLGVFRRGGAAASTPSREIKGRKVRKAAPAPQPVAPQSVHAVPEDFPASRYWVILVFAVLAYLFQSTYAHIAKTTITAFAVAVVVALLWGAREKRPHLLLGLVLFQLVWAMPETGLVLAVLLASLYQWRPAVLQAALKRSWPWVVLIVVLTHYSGALDLMWSFMDRTLLQYYKSTAELVPQATQTVSDPMTYPAITQSVIEAQNLPLVEMLNKIHPWVAVAVLGVVGYAGLCLVWPLYLFLVPMTALGLAAGIIGGRTVMFAGPAFALGIAIPVCLAVRWALRRVRLRRLGALAGMGMLTVFLMEPYLTVYPTLPPTPILSKQHCEALIKLKEIAPPDARVWTWWDWGYATHYYAERISFGDGANHGGQTVYPLGVALASPSPRQAAQIIKYSALHNYSPSAAWASMTATEVRDLVRRMAAEDMGLHPAHKQYLVVPLENLRLMHWISFYGTWDPVKQSGQKANVNQIIENFQADFKAGAIKLATAGVVPIKTVDILDSVGRQHNDFPQNPLAPHLIIDNPPGVHHLMDDVAFNTTTVHLFMDDPRMPQIASVFRLVYEGFPFVRIYEVL
ncbi:MAG: STT3 domain-containing protein [Desulfovibrionaceae bacterium]